MVKIILSYCKGNTFSHIQPFWYRNNFSSFSSQYVIIDIEELSLF